MTPPPPPSKVYLIIGRLLTPAYIESLTCNAAFGAFWRAICERRKDDRRDVLLARISKTLSALGAGPNARVRRWLDASYNRTAEIEAIVADEPHQVREGQSPFCSPPAASDAWPPRAQFPALVLDMRGGGGAAPWKAQELLEVAHSCK